MKKKHVFLIVIFLVVIAFSIFILRSGKELSEVCVGEVCFKTHVADDEVERTLGLSIFEKLPEDEAMLFIFGRKEKHSFWMKDMNFPIDIIWLDDEGIVVHIEKNVQPCIDEDCEIFTPGADASYVVEVNAGLSEKYGIGIGKIFEFRKPNI